ncbi:DUF2637 domain-containing protein [Micromonospora sp. bgisy143]|uniref:DUF2637 domain-containing protein n=1 Tax=Micromonospora sp. bgisy143 TaxID=3413790 RepID=UPI003EBFC6C9
MSATSPPRHPSTRAPQVADVDTQRLTRLRWAVRAVLTLGVTASIAANVLHARPNLISQVIAAWPPLALLLTVELISRVPADRRALVAARLIAAAVIAGIAAWVSYWHMVGVAARYGETDAAASYLLPISVDGLVVVASISLVEIAGRIRTPLVSAVDGQQPAATPTPTPSSTAEPRNREAPAPAARPIRAADNRCVRTGNDASASPRTTASRDTDSSHRDTDRLRSSRSRTTGSPASPAENSAERDRVKLPAGTEEAERDTIEGQGHAPVADGGRSSAEVPSDTAGAVAYWYRYDPSLHPADIATRIGRSERTVRRYWPPGRRTANGHDPSRVTEQVGAS